MSERLRRRVGPWERRRLAGIFSAFQALLFFARRQAARSKTRLDEESPPKTRPDEATGVGDSLNFRENEKKP